MIKITNPNNGKSIIVKNNFKVEYPEFYKILITKAISEQIELDENIPFVEIEQLRKNKSFIAKKAEMYDQEKQIHN